MGVYADLSLLTEDQKKEVALQIEQARANVRIEMEQTTGVNLNSTRQSYIMMARDTLVENKRVLPASEREVTAQEIVTFAQVLAGNSMTI